MTNNLSSNISWEQPELFPEVATRPRIIPRPQHPISRKDIDREALKVLYRLKGAGYLAYLVGGSVRDLLLGKRPKDFDVGTDARPEDIRRLFRNSRIIGRRFRLVHVFFKGGKFIEVVTFRGRDEDGEEPWCDQNTYGTPAEDAFRRDLTINALFYNIADFSIIDYVGGMEDLRQGIIRIIGEPNFRFIRDPVRMMRAIRHAAKTGFSIEAATYEAICRQRAKIRLCSPMRVRDEWLKDLHGGWAAPWARLMFETGLFEEIFPTYGRLLRESPETRDLLFRLLDLLDRDISGEKGLDDASKMALFAYPYISNRERLNQSVPRRPRSPLAEVRRSLADVLYPFDFKRALFEETSQLLAALWPLKFYIYRQDHVPRRLRKKSYFGRLWHLFELIKEAEGGAQLLIRPPRKRRRRKKKKGSSISSEATQELRHSPH
ncbi:polynucleotide adenylyltransferase PcnB [Thermosulfuriphilus sp.]